MVTMFRVVGYTTILFFLVMYLHCNAWNAGFDTALDVNEVNKVLRGGSIKCQNIRRIK